MTYPVNEQEFTRKWIDHLDHPDDTDIEFATALAKAINSAYYAGVEDGGRETGNND